MRQYMDKATSAEELQVGAAYIDKVFKEIHNFVGTGKRYGPYTFRESGRSEQIRSAVLTYYMHYREALNDKDMAKYVPEFDVRAAEIELGIGHTQVVMIDAQKVADIICAKMAAAIGGMK